MAPSSPRVVLPGAGQAAVVAKTQLNVRFTAPALAQVESVAITAEGVTIALAPNAVPMAARDSSSSNAVGRFRMVGSGFSRNADALTSAAPPFPLWNDVVERLRKDLASSTSDPLRLGEEYQHAGSRTALDDLLLEMSPTGSISRAGCTRCS
jgi:hypothetical protein